LLVVVLGIESVFWRGHDWEIGRIILFLFLLVLLYTREELEGGLCIGSKSGKTDELIMEGYKNDEARRNTLSLWAARG
jgi:hypothetical protein